MIDNRYYGKQMDTANLTTKILTPEESERRLSPAVLELFDHFAKTVAEEYVQNIKKQDKPTKEVKKS